MIHSTGQRSCDVCGVIADTTITITANCPREMYEPMVKVDICLFCFPTKVAVAIDRVAARRQPINGRKKR